MPVTTLAQVADSADETGAYLVIVLITLALMGLVVILIRWGWRSRTRRQSDMPRPIPVPERLSASEPAAWAEGHYVTTVRGADWLERVAVHGLGVRTAARLEVHTDGVVWWLDGAENFYVPFKYVTGVTTTNGMAGKFVEKDGILAVSWTLGEHPVTTGFRAIRVEDQIAVQRALRQALAQRESANLGSNTSTGHNHATNNDKTDKTDKTDKKESLSEPKKY